MSSHGGMIGVITAMIIFARSNRITILHVLDLSAIVVPFGLFFGRLANFVNGELRGKPCDSSFPLAVKFPQEVAEDWTVSTFAKTPDLAEFANMAPVRWHEMLNDAASGSAAALRQLDDIRHQVVQAVQAGNEQVISIVEPLLIARHPSQLYQALAEGIVLGALLWFVFLVLKPRRDGVVGCCFLIFYGFMRIITEIWRLPDADIGTTMGLSRGQWLSIAMVVVGLVALLIIRLRPAAQDSPTPATRAQ
jgi:phosphatidylglycerol:prolipoprotein diacylglycerol transferase